MKYIFLVTLLVIGVGVGAANATDKGAYNAESSFGSGSALNDAFKSGGGGGSGLNTTAGGSGGLNTTAGGSGGLNTTAGGGGSQGGSYGSQRRSGYVTPDIGKPTLSIPGIVTWLIQIINYLVIGLLTASLLFFLYGVFILMFVGGTNEESRSKGKRFMMWGIVSLFVMVSVWGLVTLLKNSFFGGGELIGPVFKI